MTRRYPFFGPSPASFLAALSLLFGVLCGGAQAAEFVVGSEDIPLMPGLMAVEDASMQFDSPAGRIVESVYQGIDNQNAVSDFYKEALPGLGWSRVSADRFLRDGEVLEIDFFGADATLTVRFTLAPE